MSSGKKRTFYVFLCNLNAFISFPCIFAFAWTFTIILNISWANILPCSWLQEESTQTFSIVIYFWAFLRRSYQIEKVFFFLNIFEYFFNYERALNSVKCLFCIFWNSLFLCVVYYMNRFSDVKWMHISGISLIWSWCIILFLCR